MPGGFDIALWALLGVATVTDLLKGKIYNATTFPFLLGGLVCRLAWLGVASLGEGLLAVGVAFALLFPLYYLKAFAAGDVKLLMAAGAWTDARTVIALGFMAIVVGGAVGLFSLIFRHGPKGTARSVAEALRSPGRGHRMPFGPAFLCAYALVHVGRMQGWRLPWL